MLCLAIVLIFLLLEDLDARSTPCFCWVTCCQANIYELLYIKISPACNDKALFYLYLFVYTLTPVNREKKTSSGEFWSTALSGRSSQTIITATKWKPYLITVVGCGTREEPPVRCKLEILWSLSIKYPQFGLFVRVSSPLLLRQKRWSPFNAWNICE
jgi:hypothetical protein